MAALATSAPAENVRVTECERLTCGQCGRLSPYMDDGDEGHEAAFNDGWHIYGREECGCQIQCPACTLAYCGSTDDTPHLFGMRVCN